MDKPKFITNELIEQLPKHLSQYIIPQPYNEYTAQNQAVWRYIMRQNVNHLSEYAYGDYLEGLRKTGVCIEEIPEMYGMNRILKEIGWAAVSVDGFIPPQAFMEFQKHHVLVIAADMRTIEHIKYTPAPDIVHEAAGHAPIIADEEYARYLQRFGAIGTKAFSSALDHKIYEAIRHLSIIKENPNTTQDAIKEAEKVIENLTSREQKASEMARIRNLHWWTVEYGLIGTPDDFKIYGAGLLSSIGESVSCMDTKVKKIPYSIQAADQAFDITNRQPQLFVARDFEHLNDVLLEFAGQMAWKRGGEYALECFKNSANLGTAVYDSGLQISGVLSDYIMVDEQPAYVQFSGPTALAYKDQQLSGHGKDYHEHGFGAPVGGLKNSTKPLFQYDKQELEDLGVEYGNRVALVFQSGVRVQGKVKDILFLDGKVSIISFEDCRVTLADKVLFEPEWGTYDMAVGNEIVSCYAGAADPDNFGFKLSPPKEKTQKITYSQADQHLFRFYDKVRFIRQSGSKFSELPDVYESIKKYYPHEWLLPLEILEILSYYEVLPELRLEVEQKLDSLKSIYPELIQDGLELIEKGFPLMFEEALEG